MNKVKLQAGRKSQPDLQPILNRVDNAAARLGVSRSYLYREISANRLRVIKFGTRTLIAEDDLQRFAVDLANRSISPDL